MEGPLYHVLLEGRKVGPYDRRTIVGMRIRNTLTSDHELVGIDGTRLSVSDLFRQPPRDNGFQPNRSGSYSVVRAVYSASLVYADRKGRPIPAFRGEVEARVQKDVLRIAGRFRKGFGWKEDRIKLPLQDFVHGRVRGTVVDLWLRRPGSEGLQCLSLELFTPEAAGEFVEWLPAATPWPHDTPPPGRFAGSHALVWSAVAGTGVVVAGIVVWALSRGL